MCLQNNLQELVAILNTVTPGFFQNAAYAFIQDAVSETAPVDFSTSIRAYLTAATLVGKLFHGKANPKPVQEMRYLLASDYLVILMDNLTRASPATGGKKLLGAFCPPTYGPNQHLYTRRGNPDAKSPDGQPWPILPVDAYFVLPPVEEMLTALWNLFHADPPHRGPHNDDFKWAFVRAVAQASAFLHELCEKHGYVVTIDNLSLCFLAAFLLSAKLVGDFDIQTGYFGGFIRKVKEKWITVAIMYGIEQAMLTECDLFGEAPRVSVRVDLAGFSLLHHLYSGLAMAFIDAERGAAALSLPYVECN